MIAYMEGGLCVLDVAKATTTALYSEPSADPFTPRWSPDGRWLLVVDQNPRTQQSTIGAVPVTGGARVAVSKEPMVLDTQRGLGLHQADRVLATRA